MTDLKEVRQRAWATRRQKYGERGHAGSYSRATCAPDAECLSRLVAVLQDANILSEGQISNIAEIDRVAVRELREQGLLSLETKPLNGVWGAAMMKKIKG